MTATPYSVGDSTHFTMEFTLEATGQLTDPTTVTLKVRTPSGVATTYTYAGGQITKDGTGRYSKDIALTEAGQWAFHVAGTGAVPKVEEATVEVKASAFGLD